MSIEMPVNDQSMVQVTWDLLTCEVNKWGDRIWRDSVGILHREDGPAIIRQSGTQVWYKHGALHRTDGPAYIRYDGYVEYWIDARRLTEKQFNARKLTINR